MRKLFYLLACSILLSAVVFACTKDKGTNPDLAYSNAALLDSCKNTAAFVYYKSKDSVYTGVHGPHGPFKLKFNKKAFAALTASGKLPTGSKFPDGSLVVKEVFSAGSVQLYAIMYKRTGSWLWAEIYPDGKVLYSVYKDPVICTDCHKQAGNRDLVDSFNFY